MQSIQEVIRAKNLSNFVGRQDIIDIFDRNLSLNPMEDDKYFIFYIWGQGGSGKTSLVNRLIKNVELNKGVSAYTNETSTNLIELLDKLATSFKLRDLIFYQPKSHKEISSI